MNFVFARRSVELITALVTALGVSGGAIAADVAMPIKAPIVLAPAIDTWTFSATLWLGGIV